MHVLLLGNISVRCPNESFALARSRTRGMLALLALNTGHTLTQEAITRALWHPAPPQGPRSQIYAAISALRKQFRNIGWPEAIRRCAFGYRLEVPAEHIDANNFDSRLKAGRRQLAEGSYKAAAEQLRSALELFRGEPLADASGAFVHAVRAGLNEQRLVAWEELAAAKLALGQHHELISELLPLVSDHPARERLRGNLMLALHRGGRQAEALQLFSDYRRMRAEQDGLDPGSELAGLAQTILLGDDRWCPSPRRPTLPNTAPAHRWKRPLG